ncbi:MAG: hypothetical protein ACREOF_08000 [Gemmatimonadales bacterium]
MRAYLQVSATLFGIIAVGHLFRLLFRWSADIAGHAVPEWVSLIALALAAALTLWALRLLRVWHSR